MDSESNVSIIFSNGCSRRGDDDFNVLGFGVGDHELCVCVATNSGPKRRCPSVDPSSASHRIMLSAFGRISAERAAPAVQQSASRASSEAVAATANVSRDVESGQRVKNSMERIRICPTHFMTESLVSRNNGHQFAQSNATNSGVTMTIMNELPLDIKALVGSKSKPISRPLPPPPPKNSSMTVKEQLIMYFQQQQKMQMGHHEFRASSSSSTLKSAGSRENDPRPFKKDILDRALMEQLALAPEWRPRYNIPAQLPTAGPALKLKTEMARARTNNFTNGKRLYPDNTNNISQFCDFYVEAHNKKNGFSAAEEEFTGQFQCTFQDCNKRLKNNVMFIYHVWAHVAQQKPTDSEEFTNMHLMAEQQNRGLIAGGGVAGTAVSVDEQRTDVNRLHMCPECLLEQPTPYRARLHYHRVHKRGKRPLLDNKKGLNVCNICEQVIAANTMLEHIAGHRLPDGKNQLALPYWCRFSAGTKCQFRTSNRGALLHHFCAKHVGTRVLLCPFCLQSFSVPPADKRDALVRMPSFVQHMAKHDTEKSSYCCLCVTRFPVSMQQQMKTHQEQHSKHNDDQKWLQWQMQRLDLNAVVPDKSRALISSDVSIAQCVECGRMVHNLSKHFDKKRRCCTFCAFTTHCAYAMERHCLLSQCNPANRVRTPFAGWSSPLNVAPFKVNASASSPSLMTFIQFACKFCTAFRSVNVQVMAKHLARVHKIPCSGMHVRLVMMHTHLQHTNDGGNGILAKAIGTGEGGQLELNVAEQLKQYTMAVVREELHEVELFGLRNMGDSPLGEQLRRQQKQQQQEAEEEAKEDKKKPTGSDDNARQDVQRLQQQQPQQSLPSSETDNDASATACSDSDGHEMAPEMLRDWLTTFLPLFHVERLVHSIGKRPEQVRLLSAMMAQDDDSGGTGGDDDNDGPAAALLGTTAAAGGQRAETMAEEPEQQLPLREDVVKMGVMLFDC